MGAPWSQPLPQNLSLKHVDFQEGDMVLKHLGKGLKLVHLGVDAHISIVFYLGSGTLSYKIQEVSLLIMSVRL